ncbi:MAG: hypothetical protein JWR80_9184 [Bradyrhizobium sp.]|nr:hypothetical protein [Bradyrhizobium sp.]
MLVRRRFPATLDPAMGTQEWRADHLKPFKLSTALMAVHKDCCALD